MATMPYRLYLGEANVNKSRVWLFRVLVLGAAVLVLAAWFLPWWSCDIVGLGNAVVSIRPWGLELDPVLGGFAILARGADMPVFFAPLMWAFLAACIIALLVGAWVEAKEIGFGRFRIQLSRFLIGGVGLAYICAAVIMAIYASIRMQSFLGGVPLQGSKHIDMGEPLVTWVYTSLQLGYYLVWVAGLVCLALALFRDAIVGKSKLASPLPPSNNKVPVPTHAAK